MRMQVAFPPSSLPRWYNGEFDDQRAMVGCDRFVDDINFTNHECSVRAMQYEVDLASRFVGREREMVVAFVWNVPVGEQLEYR